MKTYVSIINLDTVVKLDIPAAIKAFARLIHQKRPSISQVEAERTISMLVKENKPIMRLFNHGDLDEVRFTRAMIAKLEQATHVRLGMREFDDAWKKMQPPYHAFKAALDKCIEFNKKAGQRIIFVCNTNLKNMKSLKNEINDGFIKNQKGTKVHGIPLYTTFANQKTLVMLVEALSNTMHPESVSIQYIDKMDALTSLFSSPDIKPSVAHLSGFFAQSNDSPTNVMEQASLNVDDSITPRGVGK